jgi:hypothetical protein
MTFYSAEHAFRSRQPLPQFIPSARHALHALQARIGEAHDQPLSTESEAEDGSLPLIHALAEQELLEKFVGNLEGILNVAQDLFGATTWLTSHTLSSSRPATAPGSPAPEGHELAWYSTVNSNV